MPLSVIVTSYESSEILSQCLSALASQPDVREVVVADCSLEDPAKTLLRTFPSVKVVHFPAKTAVPTMRWAALPHVSGRLIAAIEGRSVPEPGWAAELVRAHHEFPDVPAIGGPVMLRTDASLFDRGLYWAEFGAFTPPLPDRDVTQISGANLSYKRESLEACRDLLDAGAWEAAIHERWTRSGRRLRLCPATVRFLNGMSATSALKMRFHYGRSYAAGRFHGKGFSLRRIAYGAGAAILPVVMLFRTARIAYARRQAAGFWKALPWIVVFDTAWSAGEMIGYLFGPSSQPHVY